MSARPINTKKVARLRKLMRKDLPTFIDPVAWLRDRGYAQTAGEARKIVLEGRLRYESHKLGIIQVPTAKVGKDGKVAIEDVDTVTVVPGHLRGLMTVVGA